MLIPLLIMMTPCNGGQTQLNYSAVVYACFLYTRYVHSTHMAYARLFSSWVHGLLCTEWRSAVGFPKCCLDALQRWIALLAGTVSDWLPIYGGYAAVIAVQLQPLWSQIENDACNMITHHATRMLIIYSTTQNSFLVWFNVLLSLSDICRYWPYDHHWCTWHKVWFVPSGSYNDTTTSTSVIPMR